jgi:hypothetical protein
MTVNTLSQEAANHLTTFTVEPYNKIATAALKQAEQLERNGRIASVVFPIFLCLGITSYAITLIPIGAHLLFPAAVLAITTIALFIIAGISFIIDLDGYQFSQTIKAYIEKAILNKAIEEKRKPNQTESEIIDYLKVGKYNHITE